MARAKKWTIMFYFAGDNDLSPLIVSQLRAIKDAGFHKDVDVVAHFDPYEPGAPTRIYDVNSHKKHKAGSPRVRSGDGRDPYVHILMEDNVDLESIVTARGSLTGKMKSELRRLDKVNAVDALTNFVGYCREQHKAEHYMLFLVGHGMIVGNDKFLSDEAPVSAITLVGLNSILKKFTADVRKDGGTFELLAMHSCSMSGIEVAYQLKGTANYMISSEGTSYVGCWPYRQLLKKTFNSIGNLEQNLRNAKIASDKKVLKERYPRTLIEKLYYLTMCTTEDYLIGKYSLDLCLCSLEPTRVKRIKRPLEELVTSLKEGLNDENGKDHILLAHWESQSYWGEDYTDLYDFCRCLLKKRLGLDATQAIPPKSEIQDRIAVACFAVMEELKPSADKKDHFNALVVHSDNYGWKYQYSHGLSIYFPWSPPLGDPDLCILGKYGGYAFTTDFQKGKDNSWLSFLNAYWETTMRKPRLEENATPKSKKKGLTEIDSQGHHYQISDGGIAAMLGPGGKASPEMGPGGKASPEMGPGGKASPEYGSGPGKTSPEAGSTCVCSSIKNYPSTFSATKGALKRSREK